jgi:transcriptional regulator with XRE-family HTH domain
MKFGNRIYDLRKQRGLSQESIANELDVTRQSVSLWETDQASPSIDNLISLCKLFNISLDTFVSGENTSFKEVSEDLDYAIRYDEDLSVLYNTKYYKGLFIYLELVVFSILFTIQRIFVENFSFEEIIKTPISSIILILMILASLLIPLFVYLEVKNRLRNPNKYSLRFNDGKILIRIENNNKVETRVILYSQIRHVIEKKNYLLFNTTKMIVYVPKKDDFDILNNLLLEQNVKTISYNKHLSNISFAKTMCIIWSFLSFVSMILISLLVNDDSDIILWLIFTLIPLSLILFGVYSSKLISKWYYLTSIVIGSIFLLFSLMALIAVFLV